MSKLFLFFIVLFFHSKVYSVELPGHAHNVSSIAISSDSKFFVTGSWDAIAKVWDSKTGALKFELRGHSYFITRVAISPNNDYIATSSADGSILIWDANTGALIKKLKNVADFIATFEISPDGKTIVSGYYNGAALIWDVTEGTIKHALAGHNERIGSISISKDNRFAVTTSAYKALVWDLCSGKLLVDIPLTLIHPRTIDHNFFNMPLVTPITCSAISPDNKFICLGSEDKTVSIWEATTSTCVHRLQEHYWPVYSFAFPNGGNMLAVGDSNSITLYDFDTGEPIRKIGSGAFAHVHTLKSSPRGNKIVAAALDSVKLYDLNGKLLKTLISGHEKNDYEDCILSFDFSPDGKFVVFGSYTGKIYFERL